MVRNSLKIRGLVLLGVAPSTRGAIVALHNSWDPKTAMRHAVTWQAIVHFLDAHGAPYARR